MSLKGRFRRFLRWLITRILNDDLTYSANIYYWFYHWTYRQNNIAKDWSPSKVYLEFGVAGGSSLICYINAIKEYCYKTGEDLNSFYIYGFDSFSGLPPKAGIKDDTPDWQAGAMKHAITEVESKIAETGFPRQNIFLLTGYFEDSLTPDLLSTMLSRKHFPSIVNIDCDYYSSTKLALDFLRPLLKSGCMFYFDDIWAFHGHPQLGELGAINEFNSEASGQLTPCHAYGVLHHSYIYSAKDWEYGKQ